MDHPSALSTSPVRADQRNEGYYAGIGEQAGDFGDAPDILGAILLGKPKVCVYAVAEIVTVEHVGRLLHLDEEAFDFYRNS